MQRIVQAGGVDQALEQTDLVRSLGADHVIDYTSTDITDCGHRYDAILDIAANRNLSTLRRCLAERGSQLPDRQTCVAPESWTVTLAARSSSRSGPAPFFDLVIVFAVTRVAGPLVSDLRAAPMSVRGVSVSEPGVSGSECSLGAIGGLQLGEDVGDVVRHGARAEQQGAGFAAVNTTAVDLGFDACGE